MTSLSEAGRKGGKAAAAKLTPEERARRGRKASRTLGKEGRAARAAKGWATRRKAADERAEQALMDSRTSDLRLRSTVRPDLDRLAGIVNHVGQIAIPLATTAKPKRALPKPGTTNARVLEGLQEIARRFGPEAVAKCSITMITGVDGDDLRDALSSLRTGGHVVSEPMPGSKREKLWRLA